MLDHSPKTHGMLLQKKPALTKINGAHLLKWLAAFCMLDYVGAATPFTTPAPFQTNCGCSAEIKAMEERIRHEFYEQLNDVRKCSLSSGCTSPSPPPPSPESPPPPPSTPPPSPKPPCATPVSAPGARLAVTVGPGQSQTVAVGARSAQPVAVKGYKNAYLRLRSTYRWLVYGYSRLEFKESPVRELSDRWCQANRRSQSKQGSTPQRCMGKSKFRSGTVSSAAASNGSGRRGKTANGNGRPAPVYRPPGADR